jgi:hypothetical protein
MGSKGLRWAALAGCGWVAGCFSGGKGPASDAGPGGDAIRVEADAGPPTSTAVDVLFVVDNSASMAEEQVSLAAGLPTFIAALETAAGGRPDLHLGVISSDVGIGPFQLMGCNANGDNGLLLGNAGGCPGVAEPFLIDSPDGAGGRTINYPEGQLAETFGCMVQLGTLGCGFEQTLESLDRALTPGSNPGFIRSDALLAIVILSDEDDCSASDTAMFDTSQTTLDSTLGPLSSYRCFEFGVECSPDSRTQVGARSDCQVRSASPYMPTSDEYAASLLSLKPASEIITAVIAGPTAPVAVGINDLGNPELEPSCSSASGEAVPALRLHAFVSAFPNHHTSSICGNLTSSLTAIAELIATRLAPLP